MKKVSWLEAKINGLPRYFTGRPCKNGHVAERRVSGRCCIICANTTARTWALKNPERAKTITNNWNKANRVKEAIRAKNWRKNNPEVHKKAVANWRKNNSTYYKAYLAERANARRIAENKVSGLHVPWNLQVIPAAENLKKSNHFEPEARN